MYSIEEFIPHIGLAIEGIDLLNIHTTFHVHVGVSGV